MTELPYTYTVTRGGESITPLQSALEKLNNDNSKYVHLEASETVALRDDYDILKRKEVAYTFFNLGHLDRLMFAARAVLAQHTEGSKSLARLEEVLDE